MKEVLSYVIATILGSHPATFEIHSNNPIPRVCLIKIIAPVSKDRYTKRCMTVQFHRKKRNSEVLRCKSRAPACH